MAYGLSKKWFNKCGNPQILVCIINEKKTRNCMKTEIPHKNTKQMPHSSAWKKKFCPGQKFFV